MIWEFMILFLRAVSRLPLKIVAVLDIDYWMQTLCSKSWIGKTQKKKDIKRSAETLFWATSLEWWLVREKHPQMAQTIEPAIEPETQLLNHVFHQVSGRR